MIPEAPAILTGDSIATSYWNRFAPLLEWPDEDPAIYVPEQYEDLITYCQYSAIKDLLASQVANGEFELLGKLNPVSGKILALAKKLNFDKRLRKVDAKQQEEIDRLTQRAR